MKFERKIRTGDEELEGETAKKGGTEMKKKKKKKKKQKKKRTGANGLNFAKNKRKTAKKINDPQKRSRRDDNWCRKTQVEKSKKQGAEAKTRPQKKKVQKKGENNQNKKHLEGTDIRSRFRKSRGPRSLQKGSG